MRLPSHELDARAARLKLLLFDVDGVLTDGTVTLGEDGAESKRFSIRDGAALIWARRDGLKVGWISGRVSGATARRAAELGITTAVQGAADKRAALAEILEAHGVTAAETAFMGDDLIDLPVLAQVGLSASPADAADEVRTRAHWVSTRPGGRGAVREFIEMVLKARGRWTGLVQGYDRS